MTLGLLVGRFGHFVREQQNEPEQQAAPAQDFPDSLEHLREAFAHHVIPLALLSRTDGDFAPAEQKLIADHCLARANAIGVALDENERQDLNDYIADVRPSLAQLDPALHRIEKEGSQSVGALLSTAEKLVNVDGQISDKETRLLGDLRAELEKYS
ncbi:MAG TPA: hypothetical protein VH000_12435 [Rhizomicrobium sp.]|jgi:hypothetical protein|nr:hypothetical protein [Rhizomicrobium sp.]